MSGSFECGLMEASSNIPCQAAAAASGRRRGANLLPLPESPPCFFSPFFCGIFFKQCCGSGRIRTFWSDSDPINCPGPDPSITSHRTRVKSNKLNKIPI